MKKIILLSAMLVVLFGGCSAKEINEGVDSVTGDITNAINKDSVNEATQ